MDLPFWRPSEDPHSEPLFDHLEATSWSEWAAGQGITLPFAIELVPYRFPEPGELWPCAVAEDEG
jgi:hypothetical protein